MPKNIVATRGRPARKLGPDFFLPVLVELKEAPKTVNEFESEINAYYMKKVIERGYVETTMTEGRRGRPSKLFALTRKGREYVRKTQARKGA